MSKKKITLAAIGATKSGKTTAIFGLSNKPEVGIEMTDNDEGRTKVITMYHYYPCDICDTIKLEGFELFESDTDETKTLENALSKLGLSDVDENKVHPQSGLPKYRRVYNCDIEITGDQLKNIINNSGLSKYVRNITIGIPANEEFSKILNGENEQGKDKDKEEIDLYIVDTKGLLDIEKDESLKDDVDNKMSSCNFDFCELNAILWFGTSKLPKVFKAYKEYLQIVFKSLPIYIIGQDRELSRRITSGYTKEFDYEATKSILKCQVYGAGSECERFDICLDTIQQFCDLDIMRVYETDNNDIMGDFNESLISLSDSLMLLPTVRQLTKCSLKIRTSEDCINSKEFKTYVDVLTYNLEKVFESLGKQEGLKNEFVIDGTINKFFKGISSGCYGWYDAFTKDLAKCGQKNATIYTKPCRTKIKSEDLNARLASSQYAILGPKDGITTDNDKYGHTQICAVTAYNWILQCLRQYACTENNDYKNRLFRAVVRNILFEKYKDSVTIDYNILVDRFIVREAIKEARKKDPDAKAIPAENIILDIINRIGKDISESK